jgi:hypothetical protein
LRYVMWWSLKLATRAQQAAAGGEH